MPRYDFKSLSSQDFEELARDLLQAEWKVRLEAFKAGKDKGIDLRYAPAHKGKTIIQCKHFVGSGFAKLLIRPDPTGSRTRAMTMGIVDVARFAASVPTVLSITITSTLLRMNSSTNARTRS